MDQDTELKFYNQKLHYIKVLSGLLPEANWNQELLEQGDIKAGFIKGYNNILFPGGIGEIVEFFEDYYDKMMLELLNKVSTPQRTKEKIALALKIRIKECVTKSTLLKNSIYFAKPQNFIQGFKIAFKTVNQIWQYAGDNSIDFNYYTKRGLLFSVYIPSILFYLEDKSEGWQDTDEFIIESLKNIEKIASIKKVFKLPKLEDIPILRLFS